MCPEQPTIRATALTRTHFQGGHEVRSVDDVSLEVGPGEVVALVGPSGSGKTSLLHLLAGLDTPDSGTAVIEGTEPVRLDGRARAAWRRRRCGFVVQGEALLPQATAQENVELPLLLDDVPVEQRARRAADLLDRVGVGDQASKLPGQLSVGQQQRVAIARALVAGPAVLLADEPTGSLDSDNAALITDLIVTTAHDISMAVVLVTHDLKVAARADRVLELHSGRLGG
jgi:putative ABC transport system ATP-binding protein